MNRKSLLSVILVFALILLAGCQAVGNVDLNKALMSAYDIQSFEGEQAVSIQFDLNEAAAVNPETEQQLAIFQALNNAELRFTDIKQENMQTASMKGEIALERGVIPFEFSISDNEIAMLVEGASKPFVVDMSTTLPEGAADDPAAAQMQAYVESLNEHNVELVKMIGGFIVSKLPNPEQISVEPEQVTINNESVQTNKVSVEIKGSELLPLAQKFIDNVLEDDEGLMQLINDVIALLSEVEGAPAELTENKETAAMMALGAIQGMLTPMSESLSKPEVAENMLDDQSYLRMNFYADSDLRVRKSDMELRIAPPAKADVEDSVLAGITVKSDSEIWSLDDEVQADIVDTSGETFTFEPGLKTYEFLNQFEQDSVAYKFLKEDLRITSKNIKLIANTAQPGDENFIAEMPYNRAGTVMVPVRFVSERLEADIEWDGDNMQVLIDDEVTGKQIVLTIGQNAATVNGETVQLEAAAELIDGTTYVPVRFVSETFGADVSWDGDANMVTITRE